MKKHNLHKWKKTRELEGALFFAEAIDELLFDHSLDSFKAPALNFHVSAYEVLSLLVSATIGKVNTKSISFAINELEYHLRKDPVVPRPIPAVWKRCVQQLQDTQLEAERLLPFADALIMSIGDSYWTLLMDAIKTAINEPNKKEKLWALAKSFTAELDLAKISKEYVFMENNRYFFNPESSPKRITKTDQALGFFTQLNRGPSKRKVFFRVSESFRKYKSVLEQFDIRVIDIPPALKRSSDYSREFLAENPALPIICEVSDLRAKDVYFAEQNARALFDWIMDICKYADHRLSLEISSNALVTNDKLEYPYVVSLKIHPMHSRSERDVENQMGVINAAISVLTGKYFSDRLRTRFRKVLDYHEAALTSKVADNQLLNLWSALESLLNVKIRSGSQINHIAELISNVEILTYVPRLFQSVTRDLSAAWPELSGFLVDIEKGHSLLRKTTALLVCQEYETLRGELMGHLPESPILRNRCFWLSNNFGTNKSVRYILDLHHKRVEWHVRRIYTSRNLIVHSAETLPYLNKLIENLHNYLDTVLEVIVRIGLSTRHITDITSIITYISAHSNEYMSALKGDEKEMEILTFWEMLYGQNNSFFEDGM